VEQFTLLSLVSGN